jgi:hypothetical protein
MLISLGSSFTSLSSVRANTEHVIINNNNNNKQQQQHHVLTMMPLSSSPNGTIT